MSSGNPSHSTSDVPAEFGANEWLVEEMYDQYAKDPGSVDPVWVKFFEKNGSPVAAAPAAAATKPAAPASKPAAPAAGLAPEPVRPAESAASGNGTPATGVTPVATPRPATSQAAEPAKDTTNPLPKENPVSTAAPAASAAPDQPTYTVLKGIPAATAKNMDISLSVPTATSVRNIPVKLLWDSRTVINNHLRRARGGKVSFTHLIGYAIIKAIKAQPAMNNTYEERDGKPTLVTQPHINLGLAIDQQKADGTRQLVAPSIKGCESMDFADFWAAYEAIVKKAKDNKLSMADYSGTTVSLTNVGGLGTSHSVPRLMSGQAAIIGVGSMEYPPEWMGASETTIAANGVSKIMTMTSTYDHRVIQGAQSGEFLATVARLLMGADGFYDEIYRSLRIPYAPIRWSQDVATSHDDQISKQVRVGEMIHAFRVRGHLMADTDPLEYKQRTHPDLEIENHGLTLWDLEREFPVGSFGAG